MKEQEPILITGCPRSGSTMIAATINTCGVFGGYMSKRGMYCNDKIRKNIVKPYLSAIEVDVDGQFPLPSYDQLITPYNELIWGQDILEILQGQGYNEGLWMYKDYRLTMTWVPWNKAFPNAKWVIVRRRTGDIIQSCLKTGYMTAFKKDGHLKVNAEWEGEAWLWMVREYEKRFIEITDNCKNVMFIWPERMLDGNFKQMHEMCEWLGITWNEKALNIIDSLLWGKRKDRRIEICQ